MHDDMHDDVQHVYIDRMLWCSVIEETGVCAAIMCSYKTFVAHRVLMWNSGVTSCAHLVLRCHIMCSSDTPVSHRVLMWYSGVTSCTHVVLRYHIMYFFVTVIAFLLSVFSLNTDVPWTSLDTDVT